MAPLSTSSILKSILRRQSNEPQSKDIISGDLSSGAKVGIAFGVIIPVVALGVIFFYLYTHNWQFPEGLLQKLRPSTSGEKVQMSKPDWRKAISKPMLWKPKTFQPLASLTTHKSISPTESRTSHSDDMDKTDAEGSERPAPQKWWSAEEFGPGGAKADTGRSRFSVAVGGVDNRESRVVKAPRPPSIFTSKTSIYGVERNAEPEIKRPGSKRVKTWSRHISAQFMDMGRPMSSPHDEENGFEQDSDIPPLPNKRNSKAVVTNLNWQEFDMPSR